MRWILPVVVAVLIFEWSLLPIRRASDIFVRAAITREISRDLTNPNILLDIDVNRSSRPDTLLVSAHGTKRMSAAHAGLRTDQETNYVFTATTVSRCFEIEPGCLEVKNKQLAASVSVSVPM